MKYILDCGMGTELSSRGFNVPDWKKSIWSAQVLLEHPDAIIEVHKDNIAAGCNIITTNNYYVTPTILSRNGIEHKTNELTQLSIDLAKTAKNGNKDVLIAGSFPPMETSFRPDLTPSKTIMDDFYSSIGSIMKEQVDIILCESMSSIKEGITAASNAVNYSDRVWLSWTTRNIPKGSHLVSGESFENAIEAANKLNIECQLLNCLAADLVTEEIETLKKAGTFGMFPNSAVLKDKEQIKDFGKEVDVDVIHHTNTVKISPKEYAMEARKWLEHGAYVIGGCCSTTPEHIKEISKLIE